MHLFLIRHAESVDNVAGVLAGTRDAALTSHGASQALRLATHLATRSPEVGDITDIFSSDLQRAKRTAQAIASAQPSPVPVVELPDLRERDFRSQEGQSFRKNTASSSTKASPEGLTPTAKSESHGEMGTRARRFVDNHLSPLLADGISLRDKTVVVVSHGVFIGVLLAVIQSWTGSGSDISDKDPLILSNTGYVEIRLSKVSAAADEKPTDLSVSDADLARQPPNQKARLICEVRERNSTTHLLGLKRTRGGIGSARHDDKQRSMDSFFSTSTKKRRTDK